jgi:hypothetical protein
VPDTRSSSIKQKQNELINEATRAYDELVRKEAKDRAMESIGQMITPRSASDVVNDTVANDLGSVLVEGTSAEELTIQQAVKDAEVIGRENAPIDLEWLRTHNLIKSEE